MGNSHRLVQGWDVVTSKTPTTDDNCNNHKQKRNEVRRKGSESLPHTLFYFGHNRFPEKQCSCSADVSLVPKNICNNMGGKTQTDQSQNCIKYCKLQIQKKKGKIRLEMWAQGRFSDPRCGSSDRVSVDGVMMDRMDMAPSGRHGVSQ